MLKSLLTFWHIPLMYVELLLYTYRHVPQLLGLKIASRWMHYFMKMSWNDNGSRVGFGHLKIQKWSDWPDLFGKMFLYCWCFMKLSQILRIGSTNIYKWASKVKKGWIWLKMTVLKMSASFYSTSFSISFSYIVTPFCTLTGMYPR